MEIETKADLSALHASLAEWKNKLLQLDGRNRLIFFKTHDSNGRTKSNYVRIDASNLDDFYHSLCDAEEGLKFPYAEPRRSKGAKRSHFDVVLALDAQEDETPTEPADEVHVRPGDINVLDIEALRLQRVLRALKAQNKEYVDEQGISVLYLAFGFLRWEEKDKEGYAPLLLVSCKLESDSLKDSIRLKVDADDLLINTTLKEKLRTLGYTLPEFDAESESIASYLDKCNLSLCKESDWKIESNIYLSTFSFAKLAMWEDLDRFTKGDFSTPALLALSGAELIIQNEAEMNSIIESESDADFAGALLDDNLDATKQFLVLPADYSQILAVEAARSGNHLIIHGPPGTGKSQTIANLIATSMADGKTVLFVSEKNAALDVVKRRLESTGLGNFCIDLHGNRASKDAFYEQLRKSIDDERSSDKYKFDDTKLSAYRNNLNQFARALHKKREPLNVSVYEMHGEYAKLKDEINLLIDWSNPKYLPDQLDQSSFNKIRDLAEKLSKRTEQFKRNDDSPWIPLKNTVSEFRAQDNIQHVLNMLLTALNALASITKEQAKLRAPEAPQNVTTARSLLSYLKLIQDCPGIPKHWLNTIAIDRVRKAALESQKQYEDLLALRKKIKTYFAEDVPLCDFDDFLRKLEFVKANGESLEEILRSNWQTRIVRNSKKLSNLVFRIEQEIHEFENCIFQIREELGISLPMNKEETESAVEDLRAVLNLTNLPINWFEPSNHRDIEKSLALGSTLSEQLLKAESVLFADYNEDILTKVSKELKVRFVTDYSGVLSSLIKGKQLKSDLDIFNVEHKSYRRHRKDEVLPIIDRALDVKRHREEWQKAEPFFRTNLADLYRHRDTDWMALSEFFKKAKSLQNSKIDVSKLFEVVKNKSKLQSVESTLDSILKHQTSIEEAFSQLTEGAVSALDRPLNKLREQCESIYPHISTICETIECWMPSDKLGDSIDGLIQIARDSRDFLYAKNKLFARKETLQKELGSRFKEEDTDWNEVYSSLDWTETFLKEITFSLNAAVEEELSKNSDLEVAASVFEIVSGRLLDFERASQKLKELFDITKLSWTDWDSVCFEKQIQWANELLSQINEVPGWIEYKRICDEFAAELGPETLVTIREETDDAGRIPKIVMRKLVSDWLEYVYKNEQVLRDFSCPDQEDLLAKFREQDQLLWPKAAQEQIKSRVYSRYPSRQGTICDSELPSLRNEIGKRRKRLPIRKALDKLPNLIKTLKPCFFMSPLSVSQHLPEIKTGDAPQFDVLIFDEASQIFPEDAVPAIARSRQIIVVGDEKQMPPTGFFRSADSRSWEEFENDEEAVENALADTESILSAFKKFIGRGVFERYLKVHYRSKHDSLIEFSNYHFYEKKLLVFPSPTLDSDHLGIADVFVENGTFGDSGRKVNKAEALRTVELVFEHMRTRPDNESLGVVALSISQADLILRLVQERALNENDLAHRFNEEAAEPFFVKNLEKVQGDERDHIIFCVGYGPTPGTGKVQNRFGPIISPMGPRRLNVAITRARKKMTLVRSLQASDITAQSDGARLLRRFIEYAHNPRKHFEQQIDIDPDAEPDSPFEEAVKNALESKGYKVRCQVGVSGYRIDLAIVSEDNKSFELGIECDGAQYHSSPAARDRDWLRQSILEELGWTIHRIWSSSWIKNPELEIEKLEVALAKARQLRTHPAVPL